MLHAKEEFEQIIRLIHVHVLLLLFVSLSSTSTAYGSATVFIGPEVVGIVVTCSS